MKNDSLTHFSRCLAGVLAGLSVLGAEPTGIISTISPDHVAGGVGSYAPALSPDGRYVTFLSHAKNLTTNSSLTPYLDVFVHDLVTSNTTLVSLNRSGLESGDGVSAYPAISANGRFVAFASRAGNLVASDTNDSSDVFIQDLQLGITEPVSVGFDGSGAAGYRTVVDFYSGVLRRTTDLWRSSNPSLSGDGRFVVFESTATNLVALTDTNTAGDIFLRDRQIATTQLLSVDDSGASAGNAPSELPSATPDARRVAFVSYATNLVAGVTNNQGDIYVRDRDAGTTVWASVNVASHFSNGVYRCFAPVLSANGEVVAFKAGVSNASSGLLFRFELATGVTMLLNSNTPIATAPSLSEDGHLIAYDDGTNVYVWDQQAGSNLLVSTRFDASGAGNGPSVSPILSANGRTVAFVSAATDLLADHPVDTNALFQIYTRDLQSGVIRLISADGSGQPVRINHLLANISLSGDGTRVAFDSRSDDLVPGDVNRESDVFITDLAKDRIHLVSCRAESRPSVTGARYVRIAPDCLSTNGRHLLFASVAKASPWDDVGCCENLFIRDLMTGTEEQITDFDIQEPKEFVLSRDARHVAYITRQMVGPRTESVVLLNRDTGERIMANVDPDSGGLLTGGFHGLRLSPEGDRAAYVTGSASTTSGLLYVFDSVGATNRRLTSSFANALYTARFSPDGRRLVFGNLYFPGGLAIYDFSTNGLSLLWSTNSGSGFVLPSSFSADSRFVASSKPWLEIFDLGNLMFRTVDTTNYTRNPLLSPDGTCVAYEDYGEFPHPEGAFNIRVRNLQSGTTKLATRNLSGTGRGNGRSRLAGFSPDGRFVVFSSRASDLAVGDTNKLPDLFAHDVITGTTYLLSVNRDGDSSGNGVSTVSILGADGRTVIFQSFASDLVDGDYNDARDIFIAHLGGIDSDGDSLDDDWEMAYFESLARNGSGDLDGDGTTDRQEFLAGTDPTNLGSVLRVITVASMSGGQQTVLWASAPGRAYRVQFKDDVEAMGWTDLPGVVTATGSTASMLDATAGLAHRFYRVVLAQ